MRIAVLSDIHANYHALESALQIIDRKGCDKMVFLGDILTYGVEVERVVESVSERVFMNSALLIKGNHDEFYLDLLQGSKQINLDRYPDWIRESIEFTYGKLPLAVWEQLDFADYYVTEGVYFSHANPFPEGNWTYLSTPKVLEEAAMVLQDGGYTTGVFGHTHRPLHFVFEGRSHVVRGDSAVKKIKKAIQIFNSGSVGQPRTERPRQSTLLWLDVDPGSVGSSGEVQFNHEAIAYDVGAHLESVRNSALSGQTKEKILSFF